MDSLTTLTPLLLTLIGAPPQAALGGTAAAPPPVHVEARAVRRAAVLAHRDHVVERVALAGPGAHRVRAPRSVDGPPPPLPMFGRDV